MCVNVTVALVAVTLSHIICSPAVQHTVFLFRTNLLTYSLPSSDGPCYSYVTWDLLASRYNLRGWEPVEQFVNPKYWCWTSPLWASCLLRQLIESAIGFRFPGFLLHVFVLRVDVQFKGFSYGLCIGLSFFSTRVFSRLSELKSDGSFFHNLLIRGVAGVWGKWGPEFGFYDEM